MDEVAGHELVYRELLIGDRGGRVKLLTAYQQIHQASTVSTYELGRRVPFFAPSVRIWQFQ